MTDFDDESDGYYYSRPASRKPAVIGVIGLAVVLGGGAYVVTDALTGQTTAAPEAAPAAPIATPDSPLPTTTSGEPVLRGETGPGVSPSPSVSSAAAATATPAAESRRDSIAAAKGTAAKAAGQVRRPLPPIAPAEVVKDIKVRNTGSLAADGATLRVVSARGDLTGLRELALLADGGVAVGDAHCGQNFRFTAGAPAVEKPTMMICWRTSPERSVYTVAVSKTGRPSAEAGVAAITEQWIKLS